MNVLKPLSVSEVIDRSASFWRTHWLGLFQILLGFHLAEYVLFKGFELLVTRRVPQLLNPLRTLELLKLDQATLLERLVPVILLLPVVTLLMLLLNQMSGVALTGFTYPRLIGSEGPGVLGSLRVALARLGPGVGVFALTLGWTAVVGTLFLLPGIVTFAAGMLLSRGSQGGGVALGLFGVFLFFAGLLVLSLWFVLRYVLVSQVLAVEPVGALAAFRRSGSLVSGRTGAGFGGLVKTRLTLLVTVGFGILMIISFVTGLPELVIKGLFGALDPASERTAPEVLVVPAQLLQVVIGALVSPLYVVMQVVFYVDMRVRREGLDLELATREPA